MVYGGFIEQRNRKGFHMRKNITFLLVLAVAIAIGFFAYTKQGNTDSAAEKETAAAPVVSEKIATTETVNKPVVPTSTGFDNLELKAIGNPEAPVVIEEFASLTCGHCATFHNETYKALKEQYIDTGKVYFIFNEFPLNAPALEASMIAHCLPDQHYFKFISFLFETQDKWAYGNDYREKLQKNTKLLGLSDEDFDACLNDQGLKTDLVARMKKIGEMHNVRSTPSFLVNGELITGAQPIEVFEKKIKKILKE